MNFLSATFIAEHSWENNFLSLLLVFINPLSSAFTGWLITQRHSCPDPGLLSDSQELPIPRKP